MSFIKEEVSRMDGSYVAGSLTDTETAFQATEGQTGESDLGVSDASLVQLRKACRLREAARTLREQNRYYTVTIEVSFVASIYVLGLTMPSVPRSREYRNPKSTRRV